MSASTGNPALDEWVQRMEQKTSDIPVLPTAQQVTSNAVADWIAGGRIVAFHSNYAEIVHSANAALLLSQMWFWSNTPTVQARDGWFWMTQDEIKEQTGLTRTEQETARKRLKKLGVIEEELKGLPRKLWFRINKDHFYDLIRIQLEKKPNK